MASPPPLKDYSCHNVEAGLMLMRARRIVRNADETPRNALASSLRHSSTALIHRIDEMESTRPMPLTAAASLKAIIHSQQIEHGKVASVAITNHEQQQNITPIHE
jgi:hypothetical protein